ncbi:acyl-CoA N-acyltransferase [Plectosphaerella cucumerina]|uniref:N-alpha-acetyltransferase 40 n=1 Tax=Plectosphaerella cucumerina TaxID=40658 RepID=A0A8K0X1R5_9PEZI|nr:acyl-CoA N-acyltransferase [Plectosphaerella cucumerina]
MKRAKEVPVTTLQPKRRRRVPTDPLAVVNAKSDEDFVRDHVQPSDGWTTWKHPKTQEVYDVALKRSAALSAAELDACFDLIVRTSSEAYRASAAGWRPEAKRAEMQSVDLRYVLVKDRQGDLRAFTSMMPTHEEGEPVVYCYEIHLEDELHGTGLARLLMGMLESVARHTPPITKVMLTCYTSNTRARAFYSKLGFETDALSPQERRLRRGVVFVPDYLIMSLRVRCDNAEEALDSSGTKLTN